MQQKSSQSPPPRHFSRGGYPPFARSTTNVTDRTMPVRASTSIGVGHASSLGFSIPPRSMSDHGGSTSSSNSDHKSSSGSGKVAATKKQRLNKSRHKRSLPKEERNPFMYITQMTRPRDGRWNHLYSSVEACTLF